MKRLRNRWVWAVLIVVALSAIMAGTVLADEDVHEIKVILSEYAFQIEGQETGAALELIAGQSYALTFSNEGALYHEVMFGRDLMEEGADMDMGAGMDMSAEHSDMGGGHLDHGYATRLFEHTDLVVNGEMAGERFAVVAEGLLALELHPGQSLTLEFVVPAEWAGEWQVGCFAPILGADGSVVEGAPDHFELGMHLPIVIS